MFIKNQSQIPMFNSGTPALDLPTNYTPIHPAHLNVTQIYLAKGSLYTPERKRFVERICQLYPEANTIDCQDIPHNRIQLKKKDPLDLFKAGKSTLVFGELKNAVRFSEEEGNTCPNYWHFSPTGFCPYGCSYCYLAGTQGVKFSPTVKIFVNLPEMLLEIDRIACRIGKPTGFYIGKLQDALALDPLTAYSTILIPFFAEHPYARLILLTKSINIQRLLSLEHKGNAILSWSVNPPEICQAFEENVPTIEERLKAMSLTASSGYPIRAVMMPIIPVEGWQDIYGSFTRRFVDTIPLQRLTLGGICSYKSARSLMESRLGLENPISANLDNGRLSADGRARYSTSLRKEIYTHIIKTATKIRPELEIALCLEEKEIVKSVGLDMSLGRCNCVL